MLYGHIAGKHQRLVPDHAPLEIEVIASAAITSTAIGPPLVSLARLSMR
ncbi:hypothetical protein ACVILH_001692 [Bradyrhizobium sp. USDA 4353]